MTATKGFINGAATSALDTRKADALKLVTNSDGTPRLGVIGNNPSIVTSDASTAPMRVSVAVAGFATQRGAGDGAAIWTNDGQQFITVTKPGSQSWIVTVYAKHNDTASGDANNNPIIDVVTGAAAGIPVEAALPAGATKIATVLIPSTATSTQSAGVVITNVYPMTALAGGVVPARTAAELATYTPRDGALGYQIDVGVMRTRAGGTWARWTSYAATLTNLSVGTGGSAQQLTEYVRNGDDVTVHFLFVIGSTGPTVGTIPTISLPFPSISQTIPVRYLGVSSHYDVSAGSIYEGRISAVASSTTAVRLLDFPLTPNGGPARPVTAAAPFTWAPGDVLEGEFTYRAA